MNSASVVTLPGTSTAQVAAAAPAATSGAGDARRRSRRRKRLRTLLPFRPLPPPIALAGQLIREPPPIALVAPSAGPAASPRNIHARRYREGERGWELKRNA